MTNKFSIGAAIFSVSAVAALAVAGCGSDSKSSPSPSPAATPTTAVTFADVSPIITKKCATSGCHDGTTSPNYKGLTETTPLKAGIADVKAGTMPQAPTTLTADEKTKLTTYAPAQ